jgi:hypothetical protein
MDRYSAGSQQTSSAVDWRVVDQELSRVPAEFKDPKFYALKHVVEILTAEDPRSLVAQVCVAEGDFDAWGDSAPRFLFGVTRGGGGLSLAGETHTEVSVRGQRTESPTALGAFWSEPFCLMVCRTWWNS